MALRDEIYVKDCPDCGGRGVVTGFPKDQPCECVEKLTPAGVAGMLRAYHDCVQRSTLAHVAKNIMPSSDYDRIVSDEREIHDRFIAMILKNAEASK
jgi:hypothetical protein